MTHLRIVLVVLVAAVIAGSAQTATAQVHDGSCLSVDARGYGQFLGHGRTAGTIVHAGILNGTSSAQLQITGGHPPIVTVAGTGVLTAHDGTLTVSFTGTINQSTGEFQLTGQIISGTGIFAQATGTLTFVGVEDLHTGSFTQTITGTVCLAHH
jgi:hypothetical protein